MAQVALQQALGSTADATQDSGSLPAGTVQAFAGTTAPTGWVLCEGALISRTTFSRLFAIIGTSYGSGDGSTTFALPDFRGQFLRGHASTSANDPDRASRTASGSGGATGDNVGSAQAGGNAAHTHLSAPAGFTAGGGDNFTLVVGTAATPRSPTAWNTNNDGGNEARPRNINVKYIIKN